MPIFNFPINFTEAEIDGPNAGNAFPFSTKRAAYVDYHWKFLKDVDGSVYGKAFIDPDPLGQSPTITSVDIIIAFYANATVGNFRMRAEALGIAETENYNPASLGTPVDKTFTTPSIALEKNDEFFTMDKTKFSAVDEVIIKITHLGTHGDDTLAVNTLMSDTYAFLQVVTS